MRRDGRLARVVVSGYYGFGNAGDEIILSVLLEALAGHEVTVLSANPAQTSRSHGVAAVPRADAFAVLRALRGSDLLVSGGGGLIQDATGMHSVLYYLGVVLLARAMRVPVAIYAQGLGPLRARSSRVLARALEGARMITVRDLESADLLREVGIRRPVPEVTADAAFALPPPERGGPWPEVLEALGVEPGRPVVALAPRRWGGPDFYRYLGELAAALRDELSSQVVLLPMQLPEDARVCQVVASAAGEGVCVLGRSPTAGAFAALFGSFDLVVGMRLHALILASLARVPFIGLSYDPKISAFMKSVGCEASTFPLLAPKDGILAAARGSLDAGALDDRVAARVRGLQVLAARNNERLAEVLASR